MLDFGILGNNARNLHYIKKFNDKKSIRLADNKLETKRFLSERGIPFAKTYAIIKTRKELFDFDFSQLPKKEFVVKPNQGSQWKGIYVVKGFKTIKKQGDDQKLPKSKIAKIISSLKALYLLPSLDGYFKIWDEQVPDWEFRRYLLDILSGKHSMSASNDKVILEEKLSPWTSFKDFCAHGLADIRVIVFNLVPVAAMIRVPTISSWGKANLAQWGLGLWIEIGTWKITSMLHKNKILTSNFPQEYAHFLGKKIPYRNDILFYSSKVQFFVNLWYLALDRVITDNGPKLLEINARAWLEVQKVSNIKLKKILEKISDLKVIDPEKWVEIAKSLFTTGRSNPNAWKVLYLSQNGKISFKSNDTHRTLETIIEVNLSKKENLITKDLADQLKEGRHWKFTLDLYDNEIVFNDIKLKASSELKENKIIIWRDDASAFLVKPTHKIFESLDIVNSKKIIQSELYQLHLIDHRIEKIAKQLILAPKLRPINYFEELDSFITWNGKYDPRFRYRRMTEERYNEIEAELMTIQGLLASPDLKSEFKKLFEEKVLELFDRLYLLKAYKRQDFDDILVYNKKLFGDFDEELLKISKEKIFSNMDYSKDILWRPLTPKEIHEAIEKHLLEKGIYGVNVIANYTNLSRISITMWKRIRINIGKGAIFREKELQSILAHEIDTHLMRHINGMKSGWEIFKSGTWYYLRDEEGLAIWNASKILPEDYEKLSFYKKYFLTKEAMNYSFSKIADLVKFLYPGRSLEGIFKTCIHLKKWISDSSIVHPWAIHMKEKIYLDGYAQIQKNVEDGLDIEKLNSGKLKISDLDFIS